MEEENKSTVNSEQSTVEQKAPVTVSNPLRGHSSPSTFLITLLSILLIISCLIAGFFAYQTQKLVKELTAMRTSPLPTATPIPDPTADWKTYTNNALSFRYPSNWIVETDDSGIIYINDKKIDSNKITDLGQVFFTIDINKNVDEYNWLKNRLSDANNSNIETIGAIKYETTDLRSHSIEGISYMISQTVDKNSVITFGLSNKEQEKYYYQILSTFKFIEPEASKAPAACTMDAKICPDGSAVGRSGPKCEFAPCPTPKS